MIIEVFFLCQYGLVGDMPFSLSLKGFKMWLSFHKWATGASTNKHTTLFWSLMSCSFPKCGTSLFERQFLELLREFSSSDIHCASVVHRLGLQKAKKGHPGIKPVGKNVMPLFQRLNQSLENTHCKWAARISIWMVPSLCTVIRGPDFPLFSVFSAICVGTFQKPPLFRLRRLRLYLWTEK